MSSTPRSDTDEGRYEYRVWGKQRDARKLLAELASETTTETVEDCYLLVDDPAVNLKIRDNALKIKQLVDERKGFEQWTSDHHHSADTLPSPYDEVFERLRLDRAQSGKKFDLRKAIARLDKRSGIRAVFVTKERRHFRVGEIEAESTDIEIEETGEVLRTLSIVGDDLSELSALRKRLGIRDDENLAVHHVIGNDPDD